MKLTTIFLAVCLITAPLACTAANTQQATQALAQVQGDIVIAQNQLASLKQQLAAQQAVLTTQPTDASALKAEVQIQSSIAQVQAWLAKAQPVVDGLQKAVNTPPGQTPDLGFLSALGPWGALAGILASVGYGAYQQWQKNKAQADATDKANQIAAVQPAMDHIQAVTQTDNPVAAAAAVTNSVPNVGSAVA